MDDPHIVRFRIVLQRVPTLKIKHPHHEWFVIRKAEGTFLAERAHGTWIILPEKEGRGLPEATWEDLWGDEMIDVEIDLGDGWKKIESWEELNAVPIRLPKAAE
ncbi:MAG TPA: hypothetical protein VGN56_01760 [Candidatus Paceibacterota bacterium]|jgi:hypothetical protein|nr:hypothetical protein [Candidatus Paceibacterota bacterium]